MRFAHLFAASLVIPTMLAFATPVVHAFDLTGTWHGKWSCSQFDGTKTKDANPTSTMRITQTGDTLAIDLDNSGFSYNGRALPDVKKPDAQGEVVLNACDTDNLPTVGKLGEIIRAKVKTKSNTFKATLKGISIFEDDTPEVGTCKYTFKRDDVIDSMVPACP